MSNTRTPGDPFDPTGVLDPAMLQGVDEKILRIEVTCRLIGKFMARAWDSERIHLSFDEWVDAVTITRAAQTGGGALRCWQQSVQRRVAVALGFES